MPLDPELVKQLVETFKTELEEQLQVITAGLLNLEKGVSNDEDWKKIIESIFRSAHNIKGSSRSIGITNVGEIAHRIETIFSFIQKKTLTISPPLIDVCLEAIDKIKLAMEVFIKNEPLPYSMHELLMKLDHYSLNEQPSLTREQVQQEKKVPLIVEENQSSTQNHQQQMNESHPAAQQAEPSTPSRATLDTNKTVESIRISVNKIEKISALIEEIQVNKISIDDHYLELTKLEKNIKKLFDDWRSTSFLAKSGGKKETTENMQKFYLTISDAIADIKNYINQINKNLYYRVNDMTLLSNLLQDEIHTLRLLPFNHFLYTMPRYVRDLSHELSKKVELIINGDQVNIDKMVLEQLKDPIFHIIRNCIDHGIELPKDRLLNGKPEIGKVTIDIKEESNYIIISISDDGRGIDREAIKKIALQKKIISSDELLAMKDDDLLELIFLPGFSTKEIITSISGRGVGLDVVRENIANLNGMITIKTELNKGTTFELKVPLTLASENGLVVSCSNQCFVIPTTHIHRVLTIKTNDIFDIEGVQAILLDNRTIAVHSLADILHLQQDSLLKQNQLSIIILQKGSYIVAFLVDKIIGEREIVLKPFQAPFINIDCVLGGTLSSNNQVMIVLNSTEIMQHASRLEKTHHIAFQEEKSQVSSKPHILVVDDSITTRTLEKNILESRNYQVTVAVNGQEAWDLLQKEKFSLMITDVTMPIMDGFMLTEQVKTNTKLQSMPVIIVTSLGSDAEKKRGVDVGANAYLVKNEFESGKLLEIVEQLV